MHEIIFLKSIVIVLGISALVIFVLHRLKIPSIVGFLLAGMLLGPHGLHFIRDIETINILAEIGVILLLFTIGLEFPLSRFLKMRKEIFGIGGLQVLLSIVITALFAYTWFGISNYKTAIFIGFLVSLSSTAIVMKLLSDRSETNTPHGRISVGILIFQDLCIIPFMLFIPILSGGTELAEMALTIGKAIAIIVVVLLSARWVVPNLLHQIVRTRSRELFVITILMICFGIAFIISEFGLSLALGAFLAGLVISESEYAHEATSTILPFRDGFSGLFFISVGMLMNMSFFVHNLTLILLISGGIIIIKFISTFFSMYLFKYPLRISIQSGMNLAQVGEFSFILVVAGLSAGLVSEYIYQGFLSASVLTMLLTPFIIQGSHYISTGISSRKLLKRLERIKELPGHEETAKRRSDHIIIIGFGLNGRNLARVLKGTDIPYVVLELNIATVREWKKKGEPIYYGDGTKIETLIRLGIETAKGLVIVISDPTSCRNTVRAARRHNPGLFILARTRFTTEVDDLLNLGADEVIPDEFEASVEIFSRVLARYQIPKNEIFNFIDMIREDGYKALRQSSSITRKPPFDKHLVLSDVKIDLCNISGSSPLPGKSIEDTRFRTKTGATIIAVERKKEMYVSPDPSFSFEAGDTVFFIGKKEDINKALVYLSEGKE